MQTWTRLIEPEMPFSTCWTTHIQFFCLSPWFTHCKLPIVPIIHMWQYHCRCLYESFYFTAVTVIASELFGCVTEYIKSPACYHLMCTHSIIFLGTSFVLLLKNISCVCVTAAIFIFPVCTFCECVLFICICRACCVCARILFLCLVGWVYTHAFVVCASFVHNLFALHFSLRICAFCVIDASHGYVFEVFLCVRVWVF